MNAPCGTLRPTPGIGALRHGSLSSLRQLLGHPLATPLKGGYSLLLVEFYFRLRALNITGNQFLFHNLSPSQTLLTCKRHAHSRRALLLLTGFLHLPADGLNGVPDIILIRLPSIAEDCAGFLHL